VSIFINPLQFVGGEDFDRYPRTLQTDIDLLNRLGVDLVFAPETSEMYPSGQAEVMIHSGRVGKIFEGAARPGHFDGMLTVVAKLFGIVGPDLAIFGEKDAQQLYLVRRMVADLNIPTQIVAVPTVREADGLALSSRNRYLSTAERKAAPALHLALRAAAGVAERGITTTGATYSPRLPANSEPGNFPPRSRRIFWPD